MRTESWARGLAILTLALACGAMTALARQEVSRGSPEATQVIDRIVVVKSTRTMMLESNGRVLKTYRVALGGQPIGAKERKGDHKTPEGEYVVDSKNPHSQFFMALHLSYPSAKDRALARALGVNLGGDVEIHGLGKAYGWIGARHRLIDWTDGCVAVTNEEITEIFKMVSIGTHVDIKP